MWKPASSDIVEGYDNESPYDSGYEEDSEDDCQIEEEAFQKRCHNMAIVSIRFFVFFCDEGDVDADLAIDIMFHRV